MRSIVFTVLLMCAWPAIAERESKYRAGDCITPTEKLYSWYGHYARVEAYSAIDGHIIKNYILAFPNYKSNDSIFSRAIETKTMAVDPAYCEQSTKKKKVIWSCSETKLSKPVLWLVDWGYKSYIKVGDDRLPADYSLRGLQRRWNWGLAEDAGFNYAILLKPSGRAIYYDFSLSDDGTAKVKDVFYCKK